MANPRFTALETIQNRDSVSPINRSARPSEIFGENVFSKDVMKHYLTKEVYKELLASMEHGATIDREIADPVASAIKAWALDKGATHFTHWFQPLTGMAAEKHDSFLEFSDGDPIDKFSGDELAQQEPDASSFPNGGLRSTFEARGYTAWDSSSPVFIFETTYGKTLCIPTIFVSYTGESLDYKIPLLKSMAALDKAAVDVCKYFDKNVNRVVPTLGAEQEYFLVDEAYFNLRPDMILSGRTLVGASPARGQQLDDHYFGAIPERAFAFMNELEYESLKLGIPLKTRHNEVAPSQFECAPRFEEMNVAVDHGQILMDLIDRIARKHKLRALLHEKPFARINGSGKHNNWSMGTDTGKNLLSPGSNPQENLMFLVFFSTVIKAVYEYADVLRASIGSAGNDHRLGANEAPPAIVSVFIGSQLSKVLDEIVTPSRKRKKDQPSAYLKLGISKIPELFLDNTDRNRTSPFAFTGNKFEFRAVGSSANSARPMIVLNTAVAEQLKDFKKRVDAKVKRGRKKEAAMLDVMKDYIKTSKAVRFEGDGYSDDWVAEAEARGLSNLKKTPHAMDAYLSDKAMELFSNNEIFGKEELHARYEVFIENYLNKVKIEADLISELGLTSILPAAINYQSQLLKNIEAADDAGLKKKVVASQIKLAEKVGGYINDIVDLDEDMDKAREKAESLEDISAEAKAYADDVFPYFGKIREAADALEMIIPDELWPLPKYREMLFVK
jgi:glutamine synthetase